MSAMPPAQAQAPTMTQTQGSAAVAIAVEPEPSGDAGVILGRIVAAIEDTPNGGNLAATLAEGSAVLQGSEIVVTIAQPAAAIPFLINAEQKQAANAAASAAAGRPLRLKLEGGAKPQSNGSAAQVVRPRDGTSARSRAADDPVVRRMQEKFGAEIRTVIDHRAKN
jgi:hypothetical protein